MNDWKTYRFKHREYRVNERGDVINELGELIIGTKHKDGFWVINTTYVEDGTRKYATLIRARMVAFCFVPNPEKKPNVVHLDGNRFNNRADNLAWATQAEIVEGQRKRGAFSNQKLTADQVALIKMLVNEKRFTTEKVANMLGVTPPTIRRIATGECWAHVEALEG